MTNKSQYIKDWRVKTKQRIIEMMGGRCYICGYNKCSASLALHHLDPSIKEFSMGAIRASPKNWDAIVVELKKCILVCNNCHGEIHASLIDTTNFISPDIGEQYIDYKKFEKLSKENECPICGKMKPDSNITCSKQCAAKIRYKINWDNINLLEELKHSKSIISLAEKLGCSDAAIHKRIKKYNLTNYKNLI